MFCLQLWSSKWCIKEEQKIFSELNAANGIGGGGGNANAAAYYDAHHNGFSSANGVGSTESILYDGITTISQAQSSLYTPPVVSTLGKCYHTTFNHQHLTQNQLNDKVLKRSILSILTFLGIFESVRPTINSVQLVVV